MRRDTKGFSRGIYRSCQAVSMKQTSFERYGIPINFYREALQRGSEACRVVLRTKAL